MYLPPIHPISTSEIFVSGDVTIHESAVISPGVILQAAANSRIIVGEGVCVGMGVILNAYQGVIEIQSEAILGAGVLIIGRGEIGHQACIGATTTILNTSVEPMTVIPAGSLLGDESRQVILSAELVEEGGTAEQFDTLSDPFTEVMMEEPPSKTPTKAKEESDNSSPVVGQVYINQMLLTLFPERRHFSNNANQNHQSKKQN